MSAEQGTGEGLGELWSSRRRAPYTNRLPIQAKADGCDENTDGRVKNTGKR